MIAITYNALDGEVRLQWGRQLHAHLSTRAGTVGQNETPQLQSLSSRALLRRGQYGNTAGKRAVNAEDVRLRGAKECCDFRRALLSPRRNRPND